MLDILNGVFVAATILSNITLYADDDFVFSETRDAVVEVSTHREWWREESKCRYTGVMVPYVRDWEQVVKQGDFETVLPPEPDKTIGHALVFNRKVCGDTVTPVFRTSEITRTWGKFHEKFAVTAFDVTEMRPDQRPKWLEQVLHRIERVSASDPKAKAFVDFNKTASFDKMPEDLNALLKGTAEGKKPAETTSVSSTPPDATPSIAQ